jgi:hypothetical protein
LRKGDAPEKAICFRDGDVPGKRGKWEKQEKQEEKVEVGKARKRQEEEKCVEKSKKSRKGKCVYISPVLHGFKIFPSCSSSSSIN